MSDLGLSMTATTEEKIDNSERFGVASDEKEETAGAESASVVDESAECDIDQDVSAGHDANECAGVSESDDSVNTDIFAYVEAQTEEQAVHESEEDGFMASTDAGVTRGSGEEHAPQRGILKTGEPESVAATEAGAEADLNMITGYDTEQRKDVGAAEEVTGAPTPSPCVKPSNLKS
ncbi:unnamed protein product [Phytophthora fragariaefolia]|uniref:Unnamed protein product n=1 Tax=Phytophthora fragariaefolia TaxID=1490495 RepID=A0A9W7CWH0_9STRA|nr:unnamed protein product [Phytophthora fragariaefolia]